MAEVASAASLVLALVLAAWRPRRVSPALVLFVLGLLNFGLALGAGRDLSRVMEAVKLHPILALALGLILGRLLDRSGGLATLAAGVSTLGGTPLGRAGALAIVVLLPLALGLPCGHVIAAALSPVLVHLCPEEGRAAAGGVLAAAFARTAYGACGPAPAGGIGMICEGWLAQGWSEYTQGVLRAPQLAALVAAVPAAAWMARRSGAQVATTPLAAPQATSRGTLALLLFGAALVVALLRPFGPWEIEVPLAVAAVLLWWIASGREAAFVTSSVRLEFSPLVGVVMAFFAVGAVGAAGGLDSISSGLGVASAGGRWATVAAIVLAPAILPLPCGRILGFVLAPVLYGLGPARGGLLEWNEVVVGMAALAVTLSTSCAHSPFCGGGMLVAYRSRTSRLLRSLGASLVVALPCAGLAALPSVRTEMWVLAIGGVGALAGGLLAGLVGLAGGRARAQGALGGLVGGLLAGATLWVR